MIIRNAMPGDAETIARFNAAMALESEGLTLDPAILQPGVRRLLEQPHYGYYLVAEFQGEMAGQTMITYEWSDWRNGPFHWVQSVYVPPQHRGKGLFSALQAEAEARARAAGACGLRLYVERENSRAREIYQHLGYGETHYVMMEKLFK